MTFLLSLLGGCNANVDQISGDDIRPQVSDQAIQKWKDQKFSMFIHFGLYAVPAGIWKDQKVTRGYSEQIRAHGNIPKEDYRQLAGDFNPFGWNSDSIALLAIEAGMKSIVITAKHHDGFALFDTDYSDFNIVDATPYKKDIIADLAEACKRHGLSFGVYFSLIDWDFPKALPISDHNSDSIPPAHHQLNLNQVEELMTNYGPISEIWFDMGKPTFEQSKELADLVRKLQPDCLISGRLWNDQGDFAVMGDNASPDFRMGTLWQTPASMFDETWGYRSWQLRGDPKYKAGEKLRSLVNVVANGGNYLLNIGPKGDGSIVPFEKQVLQYMGAWIKQNGEALYNTSFNVLPKQNWGVITEKPGTLYLMVLDPPIDDRLLVKGLKSKVSEAYLLSDKASEIPIEIVKGQPVLVKKDMDAENYPFVIELKYEGPLEVLQEGVVTPGLDGKIGLDFNNGMHYHSYSGSDYYSTKATVIKLEWLFFADKMGIYQLEGLFPKSTVKKDLLIKLNDKELTVRANGLTTKSADDLESINLELGNLEQNSMNTLSVQYLDRRNPHQDLGAEDWQFTLGLKK